MLEVFNVAAISFVTSARTLPPVLAFDFVGEVDCDVVCCRCPSLRVRGVVGIQISSSDSISQKCEKLLVIVFRDAAVLH